MTTTELHDATKDAHSYNTYLSPIEWCKCIEHLKSLNLSDKETEAFLRSKHMRWVNDTQDHDGESTVEDLKNYINTQVKDIKRECIELLLDEE